jgi:hypothetical protein
LVECSSLVTIQNIDVILEEWSLILDIFGYKSEEDAMSMDQGVEPSDLAS